MTEPAGRRCVISEKKTTFAAPSPESAMAERDKASRS